MDARSEGFQAHTSGLTERDNPYDSRTQNYMDWDAGFFDAVLKQDNDQHCFRVKGSEVHRVKRNTP